MQKKNDFEEYNEDLTKIEDGYNIEKISVEKIHQTINGIVDLWNVGILKIPAFQRNYVWTPIQASKFIDSLLKGLPIPALMLYEDGDSHQVVIDGQQRIKTILFFRGDISKDNLSKEELKMLNFKLTGLSNENPYNNQSYQDLSDVDKRRLNYSTTMDINLIKLDDPNDLTSIYHIFERLNTGGTPLTAQEIRNCIYSGSFNDFIVQINEYPNWKKFFTNKSAEAHQKDVELILRFFALRDNNFTYKRPMKDFLSYYMSRPAIRNMAKEEIKENQIIFENTVDAIYNTIGEIPFHIKNGLNSAVCDSVMIAFSNNLDNIPKNIKAKYKELCQNEEFYRYCSKNQADAESVKNRIQMANDFLFEKVSDIDLKLIKLYELPVSAGSGNFLLDGNIPYKEINTYNRKADFALKISGDSMEPDIPNGSIVLIRKQKTLNSGQIGIFNYDDEIRCKKFLKRNKRISLISINKKYNPITISSNRRFEIMGLGVEILPKDSFTL